MCLWYMFMTMIATRRGGRTPITTSTGTTNTLITRIGPIIDLILHHRQVSTTTIGCKLIHNGRNVIVILIGRHPRIFPFGIVRIDFLFIFLGILYGTLLVTFGQGT